MIDDELGDALPNCPICLTRLEPAGSVERPHWWCPSCEVPVLRP